MATTQAAAGSVESQQAGGEKKKINVGRSERKASMASGAALALGGLSKIKNRHFIPGLAMLAAGGIVFYRGKTGHCDMYEALGVNTATGSDVGIQIEKTITVNRPPQDVYSFWRHFENLPRFMRHLESVQPTGARASHWKAKGPAGVTVEWDSELVEDSPARLSWRSVGDADIPNEGTVEFIEAPAGKGTEVKVKIFYRPPGGVAAKMAAKVLDTITAQQIEEDLKRFKQIMETGETATARMAPEQASQEFMPGGGAVKL